MVTERFVLFENVQTTTDRKPEIVLQFCRLLNWQFSLKSWSLCSLYIRFSSKCVRLVSLHYRFLKNISKRLLNPYILDLTNKTEQYIFFKRLGRRGGFNSGHNSYYIILAVSTRLRQSFIFITIQKTFIDPKLKFIWELFFYIV